MTLNTGGEPMRAEIVSLGTELASGALLDTNSQWLAQRLRGFGVRVVRHITVADVAADIVAALRDAARDAELVIVTGGLGPTLDDLTRDAMAEMLDAPLELHEPSLVAIKTFFTAINRPMTDSNRRQAMLPRGARALDNRWGTAPGIQATTGPATLFAFPGVPREMKPMFDAYVAPFLEGQPRSEAVAVRTLRTYGQGESSLAEEIEDIMAPGRNPAVGTLASGGTITIRIEAQADSPESANALADADANTVRHRLGKLVYGTDDDTLSTALARILTQDNLTLATAESCTGGLIGKLLTDVPGSSAYYLGGFVTYSNERKTAALGVPPSLIEAHGAVSAAVAQAMATGCRDATGSNYALSVTGIAGPGGGTEAKPVGLIYLGLAGPDSAETKELRISPHLDRETIRDRAAKAALNWLRLTLLSR